MKNVLNRLFDYKSLNKTEAKEVLTGIGKGDYTTAQVASFLTIYGMRSVTVEEMEGFRDALLELCLRVDLSDFDTMDVCGTGGDGKDTFNISTLSCFVIAGAGQAVAKHGNYGVSSLCGSSTVLEFLGAKFASDPERLRRQLSQAGVCFLHAPLFHPALRNVGPIRKELGIRTFFNMLGPMVNPAFPNKQLVGVFSLELARLYAYLYQQTDKKFLILHALDGYDEVSLTGPFKVITPGMERVIEPLEMGFPQLTAEDLSGGKTVEESAGIFLNVLSGNATKAQTLTVIANAAMALQCAEPCLALGEAIARAKESLESKKALGRFNAFMAA